MMQTFSAIDYLRIDVASNFGLDKLDWDDRITWFDQNEPECEQLLPAAEKPALYHAGISAYRSAARGEPSGYPISLDAASSGLQLLACLAGCEASARLCGVVPTGHREDAYTVIYQAMCAKLGNQAKIDRSQTKSAIMTSLYSSQAIPKQVFGEGDQLMVFYQTMEDLAPGAWALNFALQQLWQPYALSHDWVLPDNFHAHVKVTDQITRFVQFQNASHAVTLNVNRGTKEGRSLSPNIVHSTDALVVREMHRRCSFDPKLIERVTQLCRHPRRAAFIGNSEWGTRKGETRETREHDVMLDKLWGHYLESGFLSARIFEYLDTRNIGMVDSEVIRDLVESLPKKPFPVISIHDCFRVHPNYGNDLRRQYNKILSEIAASDLLAFFASQVTGQRIQVTKGADISKKILEANYTLC
jgi:hypothetical protein